MKVVDDVFIRQFLVLVIKNWIVLSKRPIVSVRLTSVCDKLQVADCIVQTFKAKLCTHFLAPVAYGIFLAKARSFLYRAHNVSCMLTTSTERLFLT